MIFSCIIYSFVLDVCKRFRERKSYLVYAAVGVLGVFAIKELLKEVIQTFNFQISLLLVLIWMSLYVLCAPYNQIHNEKLYPT